MYQHNINILIIGESGILKEAIAEFELDEHLNFAVVTAPDLDLKLVEQADIIIFNGWTDFQEAARAAKPEAYLLACLTAGQEKELSEKDQSVLDDIWQQPLSSLILHMRLKHLFKEINSHDLSSFLIGCLDTFINSLPDMVWFKDLEGVHRKVNDYFCEFVGKTREEVESSTHEDIWGVPPDGEEFSCQDSDQAAIDSGETVTAEEIVQTDTGKRLFKTIKTPIRGLEGEILGTVGIAHDLTNLLNLNMELDLFLEMMPFPLMLCDLDDQVVKVNAQFLDFFETNLERLAEASWRDWYEENILHEISPTGEDIYRRFMHSDGRISFLKMISHEMNDQFGNYQGVIHVFEDVTTDKELEYNIWKLANTDALTEIANRQAFYEYAKRINKNENIHLFYIDLDNFKQVNDIYGHKAGDEVLRVTADILRHVFARDFPARLGGDEFIVCVRREVTRDEIEELAQRLIDLMIKEFSASEALNRISCSVGVVYNGSMQDGIEALIKRTDTAMYAAKKQGKGRYHIYQGTEDRG